MCVIESKFGTHRIARLLPHKIALVCTGGDCNWLSVKSSNFLKVLQAALRAGCRPTKQQFVDFMVSGVTTMDKLVPIYCNHLYAGFHCHRIQFHFTFVTVAIYCFLILDSSDQ